MQVDDAVREGGLAACVIEAQALVKQMKTSTGLREAAAELAETADRLGCHTLFPASTGAGAIAAVAVALHPHLGVVDLGQISIEQIDKVLIVEAVSVSGLKVRRAVHAVRDAGAHWVAACVLRDVPIPEADPHRFGELDQVAIAG